MKRLNKPLAILLVLVLAINLLVAIPASASQQADPVKVQVDNKLLSFDVQPVIEKGRTLVPARTMFLKPWERGSSGTKRPGR
ncbi:MAG: hypothetical protein QHH75_14050 [Bacillota bacterium]|nr:hypothetical protein [Bacillota bacterium]